MDWSFNPTLVRLRLGVRLMCLGFHMWFQSHAGSIEAVCGEPAEETKISVSIPRWFD